MSNTGIPSVLLVDDRADNLRLMERVLAKLDVDVVAVLSGEEAIDAVAEQEFALVILDVNMPGLNGYQTAERIKAIPGREHLPIIFVTASENELGNVLEGYKSGAVDYIFRPVNSLILRSKTVIFLDLYRYQKSLKETAEQLRVSEQGMSDYISQLEELIQRTNQMAVDVDIANVQLRQIFNTCSDGMWVVNKDFEVVRVNTVLSRMIGKKEEDLVGRKCFEVINCSTCQTEECLFTQIKNGVEKVECDADWEMPNGSRESFIIAATSYLGVDASNIEIVESFKNITQRKEAEEALNEANQKLKNLAITDGLTEIANHRHFADTIAVEWKRLLRSKLPVAVIMCDIDYFKLYNDTYGHQAGDECLRKVAQTIAQYARRPADLAARYGGEEFVVLLPETDVEKAEMVAEEIRQAIVDLKIPHESSLTDDCVSMSLGVAAMIPDEPDSPEKLISQADAALYQAKEGGRNRVQVHDSPIAL